MGHTPGPWKVGPELKSGYDVHCDETTTVACYCTKEDAHLIAAAPDLLEACIDALDSLNMALEREDPEDAGIHWRLEQAIKKAKGPQ